MDALDYQRVYCPYCGEPIELAVDCSAGYRAYIEDCAVCCRPMEVRIAPAGDAFDIDVRRDDD